MSDLTPEQIDELERRAPGMCSVTEDEHECAVLVPGTERWLLTRQERDALIAAAREVANLREENARLKEELSVYRHGAWLPCCGARRDGGHDAVCMSALRDAGEGKP